jgi:hypothetical protein
MAGTLTIHEYSGVKRDRYGDPLVITEGELTTDAAELPIKVIATGAPAALADSAPLTGATNIVKLTATGAAYRYAILPKRFAQAPFEPARIYTPGQYTRHANGAVYKCLTMTVAGETYLTAPAKWQRFAATVNHPLVAAGASVVEGAYGGAVIAVMEA